jgi:peptide/nickel transport system ATP-binding protein
MENNLLKVSNLSIHFLLEEGTVRAVNDLSFSIKAGETIGLVGETGAGKTTTALGIMRLVQSPPGLYASGKIEFNDQNLLEASEAEMRKIRGSKISMIFQDPMTTLNPVMTVRDQIIEVILLHENLSKAEAKEKADAMLDKVGIRKDRVNEYPHQFSGGMRQRVGIAIALACNPALLISDEPTTALDVTIQAQVLELMKELKTELNTAMIMITHDLGIVAEICDKVAIMYAGSVVEMATKEDLFKKPTHPYTKGLFNSIPDIYTDVESLSPIQGLMPDPMNLPSGCPFHPRCEQATPECSQNIPKVVDVGNSHLVKCLNVTAAQPTNQGSPNWDEDFVSDLGNNENSQEDV